MKILGLNTRIVCSLSYFRIARITKEEVFFKNEEYGHMEFFELRVVEELLLNRIIEVVDDNHTATAPGVTF